MRENLIETQTENILFHPHRAYGLTKKGQPAKFTERFSTTKGYEEELQHAVAATLKIVGCVLQDDEAVAKLRCGLVQLLTNKKTKRRVLDLLAEDKTDDLKQLLMEQVFQGDDRFYKAKRIVFEHEADMGAGKARATIATAFPKASPYFERMMKPIFHVLHKIAPLVDPMQAERLICDGLTTILKKPSRCEAFFRALDQGDEKEACDHLYQVVRELLPELPRKPLFFTNDNLEPGTTIGSNGRIKIAAGSAVRQRHNIHHQAGSPI